MDPASAPRARPGAVSSERLSPSDTAISLSEALAGRLNLIASGPHAPAPAPPGSGQRLTGAAAAVGPSENGTRNARRFCADGRSDDDDIDDGGEDGEGGGGEGDEKYMRTREKNRRAQQRFRQRQKAKLQAKELETLQLQKQVQDLQALLGSLQLQGALPDAQLAAARLQAQNEQLQLENVELRLLAARLLEENQALQRASRQAAPQPQSQRASGQAPQLAAASQAEAVQPAGGGAQRLLAGNARLAALLGRFTQQEMGSLTGVPRELGPQRQAVFQKVSRVPWQRASQFLEASLPQGLSPGASGMSVMLKVLSQPEAGATTVLAQFPPGFVHDYVIGNQSHVEEGLILAGSLTDLAFGTTYLPGDYACVRAGTAHGPYRADPVEGCLVLTLTRARPA